PPRVAPADAADSHRAARRGDGAAAQHADDGIDHGTAEHPVDRACDVLRHRRIWTVGAERDAPPDAPPDRREGGGDRMKVTWVNPCFLDYRVPVYAQLDALLDGGLSVVFSATRVRDGVKRKISDALGDRAVALSGEKRVGIGRVNEEGFANAGISIPYQPGLVRAIAATE